MDKTLSEFLACCKVVPVGTHQSISDVYYYGGLEAVVDHLKTLNIPEAIERVVTAIVCWKIQAGHIMLEDYPRPDNDKLW